MCVMNSIFRSKKKSIAQMLINRIFVAPKDFRIYYYLTTTIASAVHVIEMYVDTRNMLHFLLGLPS